MSGLINFPTLHVHPSKSLSVTFALTFFVKAYAEAAQSERN